MVRTRVTEFRGTVDAAGGGLVTIYVDRGTEQYPYPGDDVVVTVMHTTDDHLCDWRWYGRRPDGLGDVVCVAEGHDVNTRMRVTAKLVNVDEMPKYDGQFDV